MSLINQVLKDIEQRQASLQLEESKLKAQLRPVLSMDDSEWRFPTWLKLFILGFLFGGLAYVGWLFFIKNTADHAAPESGFANAPTKTAPALDWQIHPQLTKTLSSDWQSLESSEASSSKAAQENKTKNAPKAKSAPKISPDLPKPVLSQAEQLKLESSKSTVVPSVEKPIENKRLPSSDSSLNPSSSSIQTTSPTVNSNVTNVVASPSVPAKPLSIKPADPNFASAVTPVASAEHAQVLKQMKPEQEANQHLQRAMDMHQKGRMAEAIDATKKALSLAPQSEEARQLLATYLAESKQPQEAMQVLQSGLQLQPKQLGLRKALAKLQLAEGQQDKALETLQQGAEQAPRDADYSAFWALTLQKANKHHAALPLFEQALRTNPNQVQWLVGYAVSLQADGRPQEALKQFQEAQNLPSSERLSAFIQQRIQQLQNP